MSDQADVTGRDTTSWSRLTFTVEALSGLPIELRSDNNIADMKRLVEEFVKHDAGLARSQLIARRRLGHVLAYGKRTGPNSSTSKQDCAMFFNIESGRHRCSLRSALKFRAKPDTSSLTPKMH